MTADRSFRIRSTRTSRPARLRRGSRALALSTASVAGVAALVAGGHASAETAPAPRAPVVSTATSTGAVPAAAPDRPVRVEHQVGAVLEGTSTAGDGVMVFLYDNSLHGSSLQVVLGDPENDQIGYVEQADPFIRDGVLDATVDVHGTPVRLHGTVVPAGNPERITEPVQDNGEQMVTRGTNTQLATDVTVTVRGVSATMEFAPAFAFDLESRKITLYGR